MLQRGYFEQKTARLYRDSAGAPGKRRLAADDVDQNDLR
jgi:hypothetical protein